MAATSFSLGADPSANAFQHIPTFEGFMAPIGSRVAARISAGLKKFQPIIDDAKKRDVNESDTVTIVADFLSEVLGYEKYSEITSEVAIRGTYCDLAIKLDGAIAVLIEVKSVGTELKDNYVKQSVDYASNKGCDWVVLTNGHRWQVRKVVFSKPIDSEVIFEIDILALNPRKDEEIARVGLLAKESWKRSSLEEFANQQQAIGRYTLAAILLSESFVGLLRREVRRISKDVKVEASEIERVLREEVIKRDAIEGEKADKASKVVSRSDKKRKSAETAPNSSDPTLVMPHTDGSRVCGPGGNPPLGS